MHVQHSPHQSNGLINPHSFLTALGTSPSGAAAAEALRLRETQAAGEASTATVAARLAATKVCSALQDSFSCVGDHSCTVSHGRALYAARCQHAM